MEAFRLETNHWLGTLKPLGAEGHGKEEGNEAGKKRRRIPGRETGNGKFSIFLLKEYLHNIFLKRKFRLIGLSGRVFLIGYPCVEGR